MCGRYLFYADPELAEIRRIIEQIEAKGKSFASGENHPSQMAPAVFYDAGHWDADAFQWGFPQYQRSGVLINARSETVLEKPTFRDSFLHRRCVLPAAGFYEWDSQKHRYLFTQAQTPLLYLAGIYRPLAGANRFVILTTAANDAMRPIHDRMPVTIAHERIMDWCRDEDSALKLIEEAAHISWTISASSAQQPTLF